MSAGFITDEQVILTQGFWGNKFKFFDDLLNLDASILSQAPSEPPRSQTTPVVSLDSPQHARAPQRVLTIEQQVESIAQDQKKMWVALAEMRQLIEDVRNKSFDEKKKKRPVSVPWDGEKTQDGRFVCPRCRATFERLSGVRTHQKTCAWAESCCCLY